VEKSSSYYLANHIFLTKMTLFLVVVALEVWPMITLIRWRQAIGRVGGPQAAGGTRVDARAAQKIATISYLQGAIVTVMILTAVAMARGYGVRG
jgi:putative membrane protein